MTPQTHILIIAAAMGNPIPRRPLGRTGLDVTVLGLGGESLIKIKDKEAEAVELIRAAYDMGINYFDTATQYWPSEIRMGKGLEGVRKNVIISSKTEDRTRTGSLRCLENTLKNLKTDYIDEWKIHHIDTVEELDAVFRPDGALKALQEAKEQGMVRHLGISGHYAHEPLLEALRRFPFETMLMALNAADPHDREGGFSSTILPEAVRQGVGVIAMKVYARGRIFDPVVFSSPAEALTYVMSLPVATVIVGHDSIRQLAENVLAAKAFRPMSRTQMDAAEAKVKDYARLALFFRKGNEAHSPWKPEYEEKP